VRTRWNSTFHLGKSEKEKEKDSQHLEERREKRRDSTFGPRVRVVFAFQVGKKGFRGGGRLKTGLNEMSEPGAQERGTRKTGREKKKGMEEF